MTKLFQIITAVGFAAFTLSAAAAQKEPAQVASLRGMHRVLLAGKYTEFYRDWCHPKLQEQLTAERFAEWMKSQQGKAVARLFADVLQAIDTKAGPDVLVAQPQAQPDQYEFILTAVRKKSATERAGAQWHLELQLHEDKWKLMDTD